MRKLLAAATALGLLAGSLSAMAADNPASKQAPAGSATAKPKVAKAGNFKRHAKRVHRTHFVRHHRHHRMALHRVHTKPLALHKRHQVRKTTKPAAHHG